MDSQERRRIAGQMGMGIDRYTLSQDDLDYFINTGGTYPPIRHSMNGDNLVLSRRPISLSEVFALSAELGGGFPNKSNKRESCSMPASGKRGRPKVHMPDDHTQLIRAIDEGCRTGRAFHKTSINGLYARREGLPFPYNKMSKHRFQEIINDLLGKGVLLKSRDGALYSARFPERHLSGK